MGAGLATRPASEILKTSLGESKLRLLSDDNQRVVVIDVRRQDKSAVQGLSKLRPPLPEVRGGWRCVHGLSSIPTFPSKLDL